MSEEVDRTVMRDAFQFLESLYYGMPVEEMYSDKLDRIIDSMGDEAMEFFAAVTAATTLALKLLPETDRVRFFAVGESTSEKKDE